MAVNLLCNPCDSQRITSYFGPRAVPSEGASSFHTGIDFGALVRGVPGDKIYAIDAGIVKTATYGSGYGNYIIIEHGTYCTMYSHLQQIDVSVGSYVNAGKRIGLMGKTGTGTGVHLHFEIRLCNFASFFTRVSITSSISKYAVDPFPYLKVTGQLNKTTVPTSSYESSKTEDLPTFPYSNVSVDLSQIKAYDQLYGRRYRIIVSDDQGNGVDLSDMHCQFKITKSLLEKFSNRGYVTVYNLSPETENQIIMKGKNIIIEAGYEGIHYGVIFQGNIVQAIRSKEEGTDYVLEIISVDAEQFLTSAMTNVSILKGQTMRDALDQIVNKASHPIQIRSISQDYSNQKYTRGKVVFGKTQDYIAQLAKSKNALFFIENGTVNIIKATDVPAGEIIRLNYDSGMIGAPTQTVYGCEVKTLLNPQLSVNTLVQIDKVNIIERQYQQFSVQYNDIEKEGIYRIIEIEYSGDTRGNEWYCDIQTVVQSGAYPSILKQENYSLY